jgi:hypothetical protein
MLVYIRVIVLSEKIVRRGGGGVLLGIKTAVFKSVREIEHNHDLEIDCYGWNNNCERHEQLFSKMFAHVIQKL